jgi:redox-sensitive bicupin YhaK (pirin superfamily)
MLTLKKAEDRGHTQIDWLDSRHSFSFGEYYDPDNMGFGPLRVINEDFVKPGAGFPTHGHRDMEIITYVLSGSLEHKDSLGTGSVIRPGEVQMMRAGKGIQHSEYNPSNDDTVHLLQIWIQPDEQGLKPAYQQKTFAPEEMQDQFRLVVAPDGKDGALQIHQDARLYAARLNSGRTAGFDLDAKRKYWVQAAKGNVDVKGQVLGPGDALTIESETGPIEFTARDAAELLLFELP